MKSLLFNVALCGLCLALPFEIRDPTRDPVVEKPDETFKRVDGDKSDSLSFDEFLHTDLPYEQLKRDEFDALDVDHDGKITRQEYESHYQKEKQNADDLRAEYFGQIYQDFDKNFDIKLDRSEVEELLEKRFSLRPRTNFPQIFASFDANHDGALDLEEYIKFDSEMPFHQLDPISKTEEAQEEVKPASSEFNTPILALKQEKLPMLKRRMEKF
ncbi:hypothetical protein M3Y97_00576900 [Aphelenchoides bicaudatus]|nr:hypothetical protein M3Y97_00576900 [Aphelenchoides bicaudatus]